MQTELVATETVTDLSPVLSLLQREKKKRREKVNQKLARKIMQSEKRSLLKIAMLTLAISVTLSLSLNLLIQNTKNKGKSTSHYIKQVNLHYYSSPI